MAAREDVIEVDEVVLEAEAVEEPPSDDVQELPQPSRLPERARRTEVDAWRGEVRTAAIAAAGGLVAGAATVAAVRAVRSAGQPKRQRNINPSNSKASAPAPTISCRSISCAKPSPSA